MKHRIIRAIPALVAAFAVACGGGSGGTQNFGGIEGTGFAFGTITGFGSIFVNGVAIQTNNATVTIDGASSTESALRIGQVVRVQTRISGSGASRSVTATSVSADDAVEGPVQARDLVAQTLTVLGQLVRIDGATSFDPSIAGGLVGLQVGDVVEVYGFLNAAREVVATRIERKPAGGTFELTGFVSSLNVNRFQIGAITIDFTGAQLVNLPGGAPANGQLVEVRGINVSPAGIFVVTRVELVSANPTSADEAEVEGLITTVTSASDFVVGTQRVTTNAATTFDGGTAANIAVNTKVEVEGAITNGVLQATKVAFKAGTNIRIKGLVDSINTAAGSLVVLGVTVQTNTSTRFDDQSQARARPFNLSQLRVNDYVEIRGTASGNTLTAVTFERRDPESRLELQAVAQNISPPSFTLLGITVQTTNTTEFRDVNDALLTSTQFFAQAANRLVKARGTRSGTTQLTATQVELEN